MNCPYCNSILRQSILRQKNYKKSGISEYDCVKFNCGKEFSFLIEDASNVLYSMNWKGKNNISYEYKYDIIWGYDDIEGEFIEAYKLKDPIIVLNIEDTISNLENKFRSYQNFK